MDGAAAEHVREAMPVIASYGDAMGMRAFAERRDLAHDLADTDFRMMADLCDKPLVNMESAIDHPCQSLADWKTLDELGVPRTRQVRALVGKSSARIAARGTVGDGAHGGQARHGSRRAAARTASSCRPPIMEKARKAAQGVRRRGPRPPIAREALEGAHVIYAKEWCSPQHYGDNEADKRCAKSSATGA